MLKLYQEEYGERIEYLPFQIVINYAQSKSSIHGFRNVSFISKRVKMTHVRLTISKEKEILKIVFLKKTPLYLKDEIENYLKLYVENSLKVKQDLMKDDFVTIIESFIYPRKHVSGMDF